jgi:hypothetical protein
MKLIGFFFCWLATRDEIQRLTKSYGGDYTPNLSRKVTHLIAEVFHLFNFFSFRSL